MAREAEREEKLLNLKHLIFLCIEMLEVFDCLICGIRPDR